MKTLLLLSALLLALAGPAHAMTQEASHYDGTSAKAQYADPDDAEEQFNDAPRSTYSGQSGREQELLQGGSADSHSQTYGFGGYDNSWTHGSSNFGSSSSMYYSIH